jgi:hypothetical protein
MIDSPLHGDHIINSVLWVWFALTTLAVASVAQDQFKDGPGEKSLAMKTMRWGWVLLTLYTGVLALAIYWVLHRASAPKPSEPPLWKQSVESTIHCVAGDATGILVAAVVTIWLRLPMSLEVIVEYGAGFAVGLFIFQALCMKQSINGSYWSAVKSTLLSEMLSMNAVMTGMIPVMVILMSRDMSAMDPSSVRFWGTMSFAFVVGTVTTYPVNWWLVKRGLKHGMGGEAQARLCHSVSATSKLAATFLTLALLASGVALAARYGDFSMRAGDRVEMGADSGHIRKATKSLERFGSKAMLLPLSDIMMAAQPLQEPNRSDRQEHLTRKD